MKGILLLSHGPLSKGFYETTKWFMGEDIPQYDYLCLEMGQAPEEFDEKIKEKLAELDTGEGVIIFCDLVGGTPSNRSCYFISDKVQAFAGMNLSMILEQLGNRLSDVYDFDALTETGKDGIVDLNKFLAE